MNKTAIFIAGPTAVGKTDVAIKIAEWLQTEIISFDSRQFYKELKIGAAPPSPEELARVPHHLVGHLSVNDDYSAGDFEKEALAKLEEIFKTHETAVLVGGSGLYMRILTDGFDEMPGIPQEIRKQLNAELEENGLDSLAKELSEKDPAYFAQVDQQNPQRIIRALEVIRTTGKTYTSFRQGEKTKRPFNIIKIGLDLPRPELYERINLRVDQMLEAGLEEEVKQLLPFREKNSMQTVGYKELIRYFDGEIDLDFAIEEIKKNSRRYAKRQLTWFRREKDIEWFSPFEVVEIKSTLSPKLKNQQ
ncbi:tRNA isopentenyltransferase MiaA [Owenweeksia hongkongensis DSM 17368]|uniref:tRNA dimethylallyltransferase n=1 Tax=Owenweeksia hongkongensis (strain DSM 17368 / CIP 108786 / JCM 12287 / NRRL B-23963 / UST20020801) TaxID=926562 RepID=G8R6J7_OWEHD|nr:tRNA (adenosine(37)-N6)-dimethylallyltransferase MiaA [Owenweeksia hongkongensis]AEV34460.1 tRNA isopentenyltransferase MiaA [Owenweeksia hongkongensis DSM 17368]